MTGVVGNRSNSHTPDPDDDFDDDPADGSEDASDSRVDARDDASSASTTTLRRRPHRRRSLLQRHHYLLGAVRGKFLVDVGVVHVGADGRKPDADPHGAKGCVRLLRILSERSDGCGRAVGRLERGRGFIRFQTVFELGVRPTGGWCGRTRLGELSREWG